MAPRQLIRLRESRKSDSFDDQKSPAQILAAETASTTHQDFLEYILSQLRQAIGTPKWNDPVPATLESLLRYQHAFAAECLVTDEVGDCVYAYAAPVSGIYQVTRSDPLTFAKMPSVGIIRSKSSTTRCEVQFGGVLAGVYGGMTPGRLVFVGADGALSHTPPPPVVGGSVFWQAIGTAVGEEEIFLTPGSMMTRKLG